MQNRFDHIFEKKKVLFLLDKDIWEFLGSENMDLFKALKAYVDDKKKLEELKKMSVHLNNLGFDALCDCFFEKLKELYLKTTLCLREMDLILTEAVLSSVLELMQNHPEVKADQIKQPDYDEELEEAKLQIFKEWKNKVCNQNSSLSKNKKDPVIVVPPKNNSEERNPEKKEPKSKGDPTIYSTSERKIELEIELMDGIKKQVRDYFKEPMKENEDTITSAKAFNDSDDWWAAFTAPIKELASAISIWFSQVFAAPNPTPASAVPSAQSSGGSTLKFGRAFKKINEDSTRTQELGKKLPRPPATLPIRITAKNENEVKSQPQSKGSPSSSPSFWVNSDLTAIAVGFLGASSGFSRRHRNP